VALCRASQVQEAGPVRIATLLFEDGGNAINLTALCPLENWDAMQGVLLQMLTSFELRHAQGPTVPLAEGESQYRQKEPHGPPPGQSKTAAQLALADDAGTLDPEHPINANIRNSGAGLVPNVLETNVAEKWARVAAGAITATFKIPFGWHVIDDGRRTLVFDKGDGTQINLNWIETAGQSPDQVLDAVAADLAAQSPTAVFQKLDLEGLPAMVVRDAVIDGETLAQAYVLRPHPTRKHAYLKIRATTPPNPNDLSRAGDLVEIILKDMQFID
jgi:hypothetical protein